MRRKRFTEEQIVSILKESAAGMKTEEVCRCHGIYDFHFHDLRHTAASLMAMAGVDLMSIKQILGHKTIRMTLRYPHMSPDHRRNAVAAIDRALTSQSDSTSQFTSQSTESSLPAHTPAGVTARF